MLFRSLPVILEEKEGYEVYHRNVRKAEFSQKKEKLTQPAQRDIKGSVSNPPQKTAGREASFSNPAKTQVASFSGKEQGSYAKKGAYSKGKSKWGVGPVDEECFYGRNCEGEVIKIADIQGEIREAVIEGMVISVEEREIRNEKVIYMFSISDFTDSIMAKVFLEKEELELMRENIKKGKFIKLKGNPIYDTFSREITISSVRGMKPGTDTRVKRMDNYTGMKRVELHAHTQMSEMDSVVPVREFVKTAKNWGHKEI